MLHKLEINKPDGRKFIQYSFEAFKGELKVEDYGVIRPRDFIIQTTHFIGQRC